MILTNTIAEILISPSSVNIIEELTFHEFVYYRMGIFWKGISIIYIIISLFEEIK